MKTIKIFKDIARITTILLIFISLNGCYSRSTLTKIPNNSDEIITFNDTNKSNIPGFVSSINAKNDDTAANISPGFENRFLNHLQKTNYFSDVIYGIYSKTPTPPYIDLRLDINENLDVHMGANVTKAFFTGFTLFILAPVLPNTYDYEVSYTLFAKWPNGIRREYKAFCAASAYGTFPYVSTAKKFQSSVDEATEKCINSVVNQLTSDKSQ